jgi:DHA3 family macrolide efflux protein-like MFS transporter
MIVIAISMLLNLLIAPPMSLAPLLVTNHFGGQAEQLAILNSAMGIGIVLGGLVLGVWGGFKRRVVTSLLAVIGMAGGFFLTGLAPANAFWLSVAGFFVTGFMLPIANGPMFALLQTVVAPEMQGRVFTLLMSGSALMMPISLAVAGPLADRIGVQTTYWIAGLVCALLGLVSFFIPALMNIENNQTSAASQPRVATLVDG